MTVHARIRQLAQTIAGRAHLHRWSGCPTDHWQVAFEQAGDHANAQCHALLQSAPRRPDMNFGSAEWHRAQQDQLHAVDAQVLADLEQHA